MESEIQNVPMVYYAIDAATKEMGFTMPSDILTCSLLKTLAGSKPNGKFLELGTGTGLSTAWILDGIDEKSSLISIDFDPKLLEIAQKHLGSDTRLSLECVDGEAWVNQNLGQKFDYIFADTWHGKYLMLDEVLEMLNIGGLYIIDDMLPQENWPEGHAEKALKLEKYLEKRIDLKLTKLNWATGIMIGVKV
ncbi:MAG: SAM-dependent methyltransferase [Cytophagaceae bacterium BCCC1]|nr:MAG: SAM-dependent methyltransferase [Cytophagaceae bacterium BCCC1]